MKDTPEQERAKIEQLFRECDEVDRQSRELLALARSGHGPHKDGAPLSVDQRREDSIRRRYSDGGAALWWLLHDCGDLAEMALADDLRDGHTRHARAMRVLHASERVRRAIKAATSGK